MRVCARDTRILKHSQVIISAYETHTFSGLTGTAYPGITRACARMRAQQGKYLLHLLQTWFYVEIPTIMYVADIY